MASFWKRYPPGWFAFESDGWWGDDDDDDEDGDGGGGGEEDDGGDDGGGDEEDDGDGGVDFSWSGGDDDDDDDFGDGEDFGGGGDFGDDDDDDDDDDFNRSIEHEQRRQRQQAEEDQRRRELDDQNRQIEEQRQRMAEEQNLSPDADNDGIPDTGMLAETAQSPTGAAIQENVQGQLADLQEQTQAQNALFDPKSPDWIYQTGGSYKPPAIFRPPPPVTDEEPQTAFTPGPSGPLFDTENIPGTPPAPTVDVAQTAANAAARAAAEAGGTPEIIAQTAEHAARIASDRQTLAQQSAWTRAAFRSQYGDRADQEWARQHQAELDRNRSLYGTPEPRAGAAPVANAPAGTGLAPDRRIGQTPPPGPGQEARFGVNGLAPAGSASVASVRTAPPGATTPTAQGPQAAPLRPGGTTGANTLIQPSDQVLVEDATSGIQRWVRGSDLPQYTRDVGPGVKSPWQVKNVRPAGDQGPLGVSDTSNPNVTIGTPPKPVSAPSTLRPGTQTPTGGGLSPADQREMEAPRPVQIPTGGGLSSADQREMDAAYEASRMEPLEPGADDYPLTRPNAPRLQGPEGVQQASSRDIPYNTAENRPFDERQTFAPERNIVGYNPDTGEIYELPATQRMASTDTALTPGMGASEPAYRDPVLASVQTSRPLSALASLAATTRGPEYDPANDAFHIAHGIEAMLNGTKDERGQYVTWAEPYLNDVARMAWTREEARNGRESDPRQAPVEYIEKWKDAFYGSDHNVPLVKELDQEMIDFAAQRTPPGKPFDWRVAYGDPVANGKSGVIQAQVTEVDCGPNAFANLLRANGYNADPKQTFAFARKYQYHDGNQFTGPENFVRMAREEAGLDARAIDIDLRNKGWDQIDKELAEGRLVTLSSPGHYWTIAAKDDQGRYYAGATTLKGNPPWMRRQDFIYQGAANTAILVNGAPNPEARALREMSLKPPAGVGQSMRPLLSGQTEFAQPSMNEQIRTMTGRGAPSTAGNEEGPESFGEYVRWAANRRGLDPDQVGAVMGKEGPQGWASVGRFNTGTSYGPLQLHYAGGPNPQAGMGDDFTRDTGIDLRRIDPNTPQGIAAHKRAVDYALDRLSKTGDYREWYGADKAFPGSGRFTPIKRLPQRGGPELADYPGDNYPAAAEGRPTPPPEAMPAWYQEADPSAGIYAGQGRGRDVGAQVLNTAYEMTGDERFAVLVGGLVNGEGGFSGREDEVGAQGIFQFDPRYAEGKEFTKWLRANGIQEDPREAAKNIKYSMGYYLPYLKDAYDDAVARGITDEKALLTAMVKQPSRRGYGHNSGSSGANLNNYLQGLDEFKRGEFRLLDRKKW